MPQEVAEHITVAVPPATAYAAVTSVRRMVRLSPECFAHWLRAGRNGEVGQRWIGFNRRGPHLWFTTSEVVIARPGEEFAFDVSVFGQPVSRWGYRFVGVRGGTEITEYWLDRRSEAALLMGRRRADLGHPAAGQRRGHAHHAGAPQAVPRIPLTRRPGHPPDCGAEPYMP